jgi:hypothetical protein
MRYSTTGDSTWQAGEAAGAWVEQGAFRRLLVERELGRVLRSGGVAVELSKLEMGVLD